MTSTAAPAQAASRPPRRSAHVTGTDEFHRHAACDNGTTYYYTVAAVNAAGVSPPSGEAAATPQATAPSAPRSLAAAGDTGRSACPGRRPPPTAGSPVTGYDIYRGHQPRRRVQHAVATKVPSSFTDTGLTNGTTYYYTVAAVNAAGVSPQSGEASATPQPPVTVPSAPQGLAATGGNGSVSVSWAAPASNGGSAVTGYDVYRGASPGGESATPVASDVTARSYTDIRPDRRHHLLLHRWRRSTRPGCRRSPARPPPRRSRPRPSAPLAGRHRPATARSACPGPLPAVQRRLPDHRLRRLPGRQRRRRVRHPGSHQRHRDELRRHRPDQRHHLLLHGGGGQRGRGVTAVRRGSATPQVPSAAAYVGRVGSATASASRTTISVPVGGSGVVAGHALVVSLLLSSTTHLTTAVTATDSAGNSYVVARDTNDGSSGDRTVMLVSIGVKALAAGGSITLTYPSAAETHVSVDEFSGITGIDTSAGATGTTAAYSSGSAPATTQATDVLVGVVGIESGKAPTWASGWTRLPVLSVSSDFLDTAYQMATAAGSYAASGTASGEWMASIVTLKTS